MYENKNSYKNNIKYCIEKFSMKEFIDDYIKVLEEAYNKKR